MGDERMRRIGGNDPIASLELNDVAVLERIATENRPGKGARDIASGDTRQRRKGRYPLREGDFDVCAAFGLRLGTSGTHDRRCGWRQRLAARRGEEAEAKNCVFHDALHSTRNLKRSCKL